MRIILVCLICAMACSAQAQTRLGLAGTLPASGDYSEVLSLMAETGATVTGLTLFWDEMEVAGSYGPDEDWPAIANAVYPPLGIDIILTIPVIDTVADRRPEDLRGLPWSDPRVLDRFDAFAEQVFARLPQTQVAAVAIGNEVDGYLTGADVADFAGFLSHAMATVHRLRPDVPVGITATFTGLRDIAEIRALADLGDAWMVTYYPLRPDFSVGPPSSINTTITQLLAMTDHAVFLVEAGAPSAGCGSDEADQRAFVEILLDRAAVEPRIPLVQLVWSHDIAPETVADYARYCGSQAPCFTSYLASLGLVARDGREKPVVAALQERVTR